MEPTGHGDLMVNGFDYLHYQSPDYLSQQTALRSPLAPFQTYPANFVQGLAQLVFGTQSGGVGFGFNPLQPPQVSAEPFQILSDQLGGGVAAGQFVYVPLLDNGMTLD